MTATLHNQDFQRKSTKDIRRDAAAIQSHWSARERQKRAVMGLVRQIELLQMCGLLPGNSPDGRFGAAV